MKDNFDIHAWNLNRYKEMIQETDDPTIGAELEAGMDGTGVAEAEGSGKLHSDLNARFPHLDFYVSTFGNKGEITIRQKSDVSEEDFKDLTSFLEDNGYTVDYEQSYRDFDFDDDRYWMPRIRFKQ
jgi:hypothetical protein